MAEVFASNSLTVVASEIVLSRLERRRMGKTAVYIGCGNDVAPIRLLPNILDFIYVEAGGGIGEPSEMRRAMANIGFEEMPTMERNVILFRSKEGRSVHYYYGVYFPTCATPALKRRILFATTLINIGTLYPGHFLERCRFRVMIGSNDTLYPLSEGKGYTNMDHLWYNRRRFKFYVVAKKGGIPHDRCCSSGSIELRRCNGYAGLIDSSRGNRSLY
jgi:hypothetical protein